jgi:hypothetical protein
MLEGDAKAFAAKAKGAGAAVGCLWREVAITWGWCAAY